MTATDRESIDLFTRTTTVICFAILMAVPIYVVVAYLVVGQNAITAVPELAPVVVWVLAAIAVAQLLVASVVAGKLKTAAASKPTAEERLASYRVSIIVGFALRESTAIIGLVITFLSGDLVWCVGLGALSIASMLLAWPKRSEAEALAADPATAPIG